MQNLPCDYCAEHASKIIPRLNLNTISTKDKLKQFYFDFHNSVNERTQQTTVDKSILEKYKKGNFKKSAELLYQTFHTHDKEHMMNEFTRNRMLNSIKPNIRTLINIIRQ